MAYRVTHGYVTVPTAVDGESRAYIDIPRGAMLPADVEDEHIATLVERGHIEPVDDDPDGPGIDITGDGVPEGSIAQILGWVGDDVDKARLALAAENAAEKPRVGLVAELTKLIPAE